VPFCLCPRRLASSPPPPFFRSEQAGQETISSTSFCFTTLSLSSLTCCFLSYAGLFLYPSFLRWPSGSENPSFFSPTCSLLFLRQGTPPPPFPPLFAPTTTMTFFFFFFFFFSLPASDLIAGLPPAHFSVRSLPHPTRYPLAYSPASAVSFWLQIAIHADSRPSSIFCFRLFSTMPPFQPFPRFRGVFEIRTPLVAFPGLLFGLRVDL